MVALALASFRVTRPISNNSNKNQRSVILVILLLIVRKNVAPIACWSRAWSWGPIPVSSVAEHFMRLC